MSVSNGVNLCDLLSDPLALSDSPAVSSREFYLHDDVTFSPVSAILDACVHVRYSSILQQGEVNVGDELATEPKLAYILLSGLLNCLVYLKPACYGSFST